MKMFEILGPVMIGPSSSHTAGAVRLGNLALSVLGQPVRCAKIGLHGSFAETYKGHGTDVALVAGLMGWATDDERIPHSFDYARKAGVQFSIGMVDLGGLAHPNSVQFTLTGQNDHTISVTGCSIGGGKVQITQVSGFDLQMTGQFYTLLVMHNDQPGAIMHVTEVLSTYGVNIAQMRVSRQRKGGKALMVLETDQDVCAQAVEQIGVLPSIETVRGIAAV